MFILFCNVIHLFVIGLKIRASNRFEIRNLQSVWNSELVIVSYFGTCNRFENQKEHSASKGQNPFFVLKALKKIYRKFRVFNLSFTGRMLSSWLLICCCSYKIFLEIDLKISPFPLWYDGNILSIFYHTLPKFFWFLGCLAFVNCIGRIGFCNFLGSYDVFVGCQAYSYV